MTSLTTAPPAAGGADRRSRPSHPVFTAIPPGDRYERHPGDVLRLVAWTISTVALVAVIETAERTTQAIDGDVAGWIDSIPESGRQLGRIAIAVVALLALAIVVLALVVRSRWRRLITLGATGALAGGVVIGLGELTGLIDDAAVLDEAVLAEGIAPQAPIVGLAAAVALAMVARPWTSAQLRRVVRWTLVAGAAVLVLSSALSAIELALAVAVGNVVAAAVLVAVGAPNRRPSARALALALEGAGIAVVDVATQRAIAGRAELRSITTAEGTLLFVKVYGEDCRDADRLYRALRAVLVKGPAEAIVSPRRRAEHEALALFVGERAELPWPRPRAVVPVGDASAAVVMTAANGRRLDELTPDELTPALLETVWREVARMHCAGLAHRALRATNVVVTAAGPMFVGLGSVEIGADEPAIVVDRAELLASITALVGPEVAVASATAVMAPADVAATMPYLQRLALSSTTGRQGSRRDLEQLRRQVAAATEQDLVPLVRLARVRPRTVLTVAALTGAFYLLLPQLANVDDSVAALRSADWPWLLLVVALSVLTYGFAALSLMGGVRARLPLGRTVEVQLASSFVNRVTPANVGGMALGVRYMQRAGIGSGEAVTGVALNVLAGAVVHIALLIVFVAWARQQPGTSFSMPSGSTALVVIVVVLCVLGVVAATRRGRKLLRSRLLPFGRESLANLAGVVRSPARLAALFGGSLGLTLAYGTAFGCAVQAFGGGVGIPEVGAVYLGASALAAVAPTPGGLGAMEAALITGLTGAGMEPSLALAAVLTYRLATFWLPILPGWLAFVRLERHGHL